MACLGVGKLEKSREVNQGWWILTVDIVMQSVVRQFEGREFGVGIPLEMSVSASHQLKKVDTVDLQ
jgi:hypothetical protein